MDIRDKALQVILKAKNPLISSVGEDGYPYTKAMLPPREHDGLSVFYFTTNTSSLRVSQYRKNPKASVYFFDAGSFTGVLLLGEMEVFTDQISRERIWRAGDTLYYPQGVTDADYAVLCFTARSGRLYEKFGTKDFGVP
ncbi:MAG: pyridoxamine 5'-phosphate oxidase family protein [Spirochaetota bacterium]|nr:pyridoxamine 5'-phosphate oxidase family protein [Spirochaetota bacterium]